jgi:hypothetical protein
MADATLAIVKAETSDAVMSGLASRLERYRIGILDNKKVFFARVSRCLSHCARWLTQCAREQKTSVLSSTFGIPFQSSLPDGL